MRYRASSATKRKILNMKLWSILEELAWNMRFIEEARLLMMSAIFTAEEKEEEKDKTGETQRQAYVPRWSSERKKQVYNA